ncbi:MAG: sigma-70 family RNA polymerase sigma factor [Ignavibacteriaceae bacterium]|jgi:RNA polymerase sigma factor, sigma-70 family|nr:sigma-70 family RNA polymerase sigma factor [Ignavibacteria bacterium]MEB2329712.1 sigma-70 family RNA polymerase sigma factor [Ignavibacteriaceae bacterium]OQY77329.1 MAG: hypothetical protein B6D43_06880 [Ignavibacteriales bacterium UTCHB1]
MNAELNVHSEMTDDLLIKNALGGDKNSFGKLFNKYSGKVLKFTFRLSGDIDSANDLTQRTFIKVWENLNTFNPGKSFSPWIKKIALNEFLMDMRTEKRLSQKHSEMEKLSQQKQVPGTDNKMDLEYSISKLPENQRLVFCLFHLEGFSIKEISSLLDLNEGTVKSHLHTSRKKLSEVLQNG